MQTWGIPVTHLEVTLKKFWSGTGDPLNDESMLTQYCVSYNDNKGMGDHGRDTEPILTQPLRKRGILGDHLKEGLISAWERDGYGVGGRVQPEESHLELLVLHTHLVLSRFYLFYLLLLSGLLSLFLPCYSSLASTFSL